MNTFLEIAMNQAHSLYDGQVFKKNEENEYVAYELREFFLYNRIDWTPLADVHVFFENMDLVTAISHETVEDFAATADAWNLYEIDLAARDVTQFYLDFIQAKLIFRIMDSDTHDPLNLLIDAIVKEIEEIPLDKLNKEYQDAMENITDYG